MQNIRQPGKRVRESIEKEGKTEECKNKKIKQRLYKIHGNSSLQVKNLKYKTTVGNTNESSLIGETKKCGQKLVTINSNFFYVKGQSSKFT